MSFTLWFTGISGAGKTTLSRLIYREFKSRDLRVEILDGDIVRTNFGQELGFTKKDRDINVRRIGFVSYLLNKNEVVSIVAAIAPYAETRDINRRLIKCYLEVYCCCPLEVAESRDVKGLYVKARAGEIPYFTGISDPYEEPEAPEILVNTDLETIEASVAKIIASLEAAQLIPQREKCTINHFSEEDELRWRQRLASLGFCKI
jgi:adenylylsulfate kinase